MIMAAALDTQVYLAAVVSPLSCLADGARPPSYITEPKLKTVKISKNFNPPNHSGTSKGGVSVKGWLKVEFT